MQTATATSAFSSSNKFPTSRLLDEPNEKLNRNLKPSFFTQYSSQQQQQQQPRLLPRILPLLPTEPTTPQLPLAPFTRFTASAEQAATMLLPNTDAPSSSAQTLLSLFQRSQDTTHKRGFSSEEEDDEGYSYGTWTPERKRTKTKSRKPTYLVRKEEKDLLLEQVEKLQAQVDFLRQRSGITEWQGKDQQLVQKEITNNMLREAVRNQQFAFFSAQSAVSEIMTAPERCPIDTCIRLSKDWTKRRETLVALKAQKLHDAQQLLEKRTQFIDSTKEFAEDTHFSTDNGDYCQVSFKTIPLPGATSVRQVYDTLHFHTQNMERSIGEAIGTVLTSDGDDNWDKTILHRRMVRSNVRDVLTESNFVVFTEFINDPSQWTKGSGSSSKELGVIVLDYVDEDELYPYRSRQCIRQDVTGVMTLRAVPCKPRNKGGERAAAGSPPSQEDYVVVITKWIMLKLKHNSAIEIPTPKMQELKDRISEIANALVRAVQASPSMPVYTASSSTQRNHEDARL